VVAGAAVVVEAGGVLLVIIYVPVAGALVA